MYVGYIGCENERNSSVLPFAAVEEDFCRIEKATLAALIKTAEKALYGYAVRENVNDGIGLEENARWNVSCVENDHFVLTVDASELCE
jgi:hypothetical protein